MRIGIDLMGGDSPPQLLYPAVIKAAKQLDAECTLLVIATKQVVDGMSHMIAKSPPRGSARIEFQIAEDVIAMGEDPLSAIRKKSKSSLVLGMRLLKKKALDAFVSCGNTGALIASATLFLPHLPGISRPALLVPLPTKKGPVAVLDVGGMVSCKAEHLIHFAHLGAAYQRAVQGVKFPTVGLLNIGVESKKGTAEVRQAYEHLQGLNDIDSKMHFAGNVEGREVFNGSVDVLVTDGFTGNVMLKTAEGVSAFIFDALQDIMKGASKEFREAFVDLQKHFTYSEYPGAIICGVDGLVMKVHGNASEEALFSSILGAADCVRKEVIPLIKKSMMSGSL